MTKKVIDVYGGAVPQTTILEMWHPSVSSVWIRTKKAINFYGRAIQASVRTASISSVPWIISLF
jgi:hypothetical protein